jgi:hypothetical protein
MPSFAYENRGEKPKFRHLNLSLGGTQLACKPLGRALTHHPQSHGTIPPSSTPNFNRFSIISSLVEGFGGLMQALLSTCRFGHYLSNLSPQDSPDLTKTSPGEVGSEHRQHHR